MEKLILTLLVFLIPSIFYVVYGQDFQNARINTVDTTYEWFLTGVFSPTPVPLYMKTKKLQYVNFMQKKFQLSAFDSTKNDGTPKRIAWLDNFGNFKISPASSFNIVLTASAVTSALGGTPIIPSGLSSQYYRGDGTLANFSTSTRTTVSSGSGLNYNSSTGQFSNTAQDQVISILGLGTTIVSGIYPTFTVNTSATDLSNYYDKTQSDSRYLQSFTESDPIWTSSPSHSITGTNISNWNTAFGWGNHAIQGYLTSTSNNTLTNKSGNISQWNNDSGYLVAEIDGSINNEIQFPTISGQTLSLSGTSITAIIPTQTTSLVGNGATSVVGTYPNFTISSSAQTLQPIPNNTLISSGYSIGILNSNTISLPSPTTQITAGSLNIIYGATPLFSQTPQNLTYSSNILQISGGNTVNITPTLSASSITSAIGFIPYNGMTNSNGYISNYSETDPLFDTKFSIKSTTNLVEGTNLYYTSARTRTTISAGTNISYNNSTGVITNSTPDQTIVISGANSLSVTSSYPTFTLTPYSPTTQTVTRPINSSTFQPSSTQMSWVFYTIRITCVATIGSNSSGTVTLQYSSDSGLTWTDVGQIENSNTVTLAITLNSTTIQTAQLSGVIPKGAICRMNSSGTATLTYIKGQETN